MNVAIVKLEKFIVKNENLYGKVYRKVTSMAAVNIDHVT